jgi:hypothetical protein
MKIAGLIKEGCAGPDGLREYHVDLSVIVEPDDSTDGRLSGLTPGGSCRDYAAERLARQKAEVGNAIQTLDSLIDGDPESDLGRLLTPIKGLLVARERRVTSWEDISEELAARIRRYDRAHS